MITLEKNQVKAFGQLEVWQLDMGNKRRNVIKEKDWRKQIE